MERIPPSGTLRIYDLACKLEDEGKPVYHFEVGQPDFPTPNNIVDAAIDAMQKGMTRYTSSRGIPQLLDAIEASYNKRGIQINGRKNVIVTPGAKMALFQGFLATIDDGDDVLVLSPSWPTYKVMLRILGAKPVDVETFPGYKIDEEKLKCKISRTVSAVVVNTPNNPTGGVLSRKDLKLLHDLAEDHDFVVYSDEIYESLTYDGTTQTSMLELDPAMEHTCVISGFSKAYSMTGWRLGYAICNAETIDNMVRIQQNTTSCATSFVQAAGVEALAGDQSFVKAMRDEYQKRRDEIVRLFCEIESVHCVSPEGAFYVFPDFSEIGLSSNTLAELLLKKTGVTTAPGIMFGESYDNHLRFSYPTSIETIREGIGRMAHFLDSL
jgi:aspartate/methionine/tyrosine aminotransferase